MGVVLESLPGELFPVGSCPRVEPLPGELSPVGSCLESLHGELFQWGVVLE